MDTKKFFLIWAAIVGLTLVALKLLNHEAEIRLKQYEQKNFEPLCEYRGGSFTTSPRQHHYRHHYHRYRRPLPVKTYFKPIYPQRRKIRHRRRRVKRIC